MAKGSKQEALKRKFYYVLYQPPVLELPFQSKHIDPYIDLYV